MRKWNSHFKGTAMKQTPRHKTCQLFHLTLTTFKTLTRVSRSRILSYKLESECEEVWGFGPCTKCTCGRPAGCDCSESRAADAGWPDQSHAKWGSLPRSDVCADNHMVCSCRNPCRARALGAAAGVNPLTAVLIVNKEVVYECYPLYIIQRK